MKYRLGKLLKKGDTIGLTAPAGPVDEEKLHKAIATLKNMGFNLEVGLTCYQDYGGYLAGPPELRANELNEMFVNPNIDGIFCLRGGYGSAHILPMLDYDKISNHPKAFVGYSDITALHIALQQKSSLATIHGPMPASDLITASDFTIDTLLHVLTTPAPIGQIQNPADEQIRCLVQGEAKGPLIGGNLTVMTSLLGTPFEIDTKGKILFLEDIGEEPYRVDRMLTQLALAGKFQDAAGIILGTWTDCVSHDKESFQVEDLFENIIAPFRKPTIYNVRAGHNEPTLPLPFGRVAYIDAEEGTFYIN